MSIEPIQARILKLVTQLKQTLITEPEFRAAVTDVLDAIAVEGHDVQIEILDRDGGMLASYGPTAAGERTQQLEFRELSDSWAVQCKATAWACGKRKLSPAQFGPLLQALGSAFELHWGHRDQMVLLPRAQDPLTRTRLLNFVEAVEIDGYLVVMHFDLDGFGQINKDPAAGEPVANAVLREFGKRTYRTFCDVGIAIRTLAGDEFSCFFHTKDPAPLLSRIETFRRRMESEPFAAIGRPMRCSVGLAIYHPPPNRRFTHEDEILEHARQAETQAKACGKNCIRISGVAKNELVPAGDLREQLLEITLRSRLDLHRSVPSFLGTPYARLIAAELADRFAATTLAECDATHREVLRVHGLHLGASNCAEIEGRWSDQVASAEWAGLVAWALLKATFTKSQPVSPDLGLSFVITPQPGDQSILALSIEKAGKRQMTIEIGKAGAAPACQVSIGSAWYPHSHDGNGTRRWVPNNETEKSPAALMPVLLLLIGEEAVPVAGNSADLAAAVIAVDDRPVKGGGLPDFWQSNLSRIIWACLLNPNIQEIVAVGAVANAPLTLQWLRADAGQWTEAIYDLQRMLAIPGHHLSAFRDRNLRVTVVQDTASLLAALSRASLEATSTKVTSAVDLKTELGRQRRISSPPPDENNRLSVVDGLRSRTLADAYPRAIQILRSQTEDAQTEQPGRRFTEVQSFKLVLTDPLQDKVPDYWRPSTQGLREYYDRNFKDPDGLFQKQLSASHGEGNETEYQHALRTCVEFLRQGKPSRRVTLPLGAYPKGHRDPIGWFAIQIFPRLRNGRWRLDFNWSWRTVEVLVGFPFSVYGSIEWSREFCEAVQAELSGGKKPMAIEFGQLIYIALSFHMFLDDGELEIARSIVNDATD